MEEEKKVVEAEEQAHDPTGRRQFLKTTVAAATTGLVAGSGIAEAKAAEPVAQGPCPPPPPERLRLVLGTSVKDLSQVRIPGLRKPFEQLTISELVQLRPTDTVQDTYDVNAVTDNISVSTAALLHELGKIRQISEMQQEIVVNEIRSGFKPGD